MSIQLTGFEAAIKNFLDDFAKEDKEFATTYAKPNKSISECCKYIIKEVEKKNSSKARCVACTDEEVYGMAIHYYDEDDIVVEEPKTVAKVVASNTDSAKAPETKTRKPRKAKVSVDSDIPEPLEIPMF